LVSAAIIIAALYFGRDILMPLLLAFLFGFVLSPLVERLHRWGVPQTLAVTMVVAASLTTLILAGLALGGQVRELSAELPTYRTTIQTKVRDLRQRIDAPGIFDGAFELLDTVKKEVERKSPDQPGVLPARQVQRVQIDVQEPSPIAQGRAWLEAGLGPLAMAGIVLVFVFLVLKDRQDLRDRLMRLLGGNLHRTTDAMNEAGERISRYLIMQLVVNACFGIPMAIGLWLIGVPGAIVWGALATVMRFVPYIGAMLFAFFPLALAFAVDPGWSMLLWTIALIGLLELFIVNVIEPWMYGASTGLSAMSLIVSASFWTALWGPIGLVISTPLTVCLLVIGRHLRPQFEVAAKRAADVFDVRLALVSMIDDELQLICGVGGELAGSVQAMTTDGGEQPTIPRSLSVCGHVVASAETLIVEDIARDPRFANNPVLHERGLRFYAGAPLRDARGTVYGSLCLLDTVPRVFTERETRLLEGMAAELMREVLKKPDGSKHTAPAAVAPDLPPDDLEPPSATVGQPVPN
jgi:predicted PurR-regulated permease PerM